jgi:DNA repair exonuclease SbcCD ATPase subunit
MRRCVSVCAVLVAAGLSAQTQSGGYSPGTDQQGEPSAPAARYSPLAAQGGYADGRTSPLEAVIHTLNPHDVNLGDIWEQRRRQWLENASANPYFWFGFAVTVALILSWFVLAWVHTDRVRERWQLAEHAADALRYAEYCKRRASEAIGRYNEHVEKCNRLIEAGESGLATPETANLEDYRREITRLAADNDSKDLQVKRLQEELERKAQELSDIARRIEQAEQRLNARSKLANNADAQAKLAERINRLETENHTLAEENRRLRQRSGSNKAVAVEDQVQPEKSGC